MSPIFASKPSNRDVHQTQKWLALAAFDADLPASTISVYYGGATGDVEVMGQDGLTAILVAVPSGTFIDGAVKQIVAAGTTSAVPAEFVALYK